jgi:hypothetical protein
MTDTGVGRTVALGGEIGDEVEIGADVSTAVPPQRDGTAVPTITDW